MVTLETSRKRTQQIRASVDADSLDLSASGVTRDAQARDLLEDSLKGILAMWRIAAQEKAPEMVSAIRRFKVESNGDVVSISGTLPAATLRAFSQRRGEGR